MCPSCWAECTPPDPEFRCPHCFAEWEEYGLCPECRTAPQFFFIRAALFEPWGAAHRLYSGSGGSAEGLAGYALYQWAQLDWPLPDFVVPLPQRLSIGIAKRLAEGLGVPYANPFTRWCNTLIDDLLPEDASLLVIDPGMSFALLKKYETELAKACPKKCFLLSLAG
jgi:hypothetical protein